MDMKGIVTTQQFFQESITPEDLHKSPSDQDDIVSLVFNKNKPTFDKRKNHDSQDDDFAEDGNSLLICQNKENTLLKSTDGLHSDHDHTITNKAIISEDEEDTDQKSRKVIKDVDNTILKPKKLRSIAAKP